MADSRVSIIIAGRALCRRKNGMLEGLLWQADARHILKLRVTKKFKDIEIWTGEYEIPKQTQIFFTNTASLSSVPPLPNPDIAPFSTIMDLDAHHRPEEPNISLKLFPHPLPDDPVTSYFNIPNVDPNNCYANKLSNFAYATWKHTKLPGTPPLPGTKTFKKEERVGDEIGIDFLIPAGKELTMRLDLLNTIPPAPPVPATLPILLSFPQEDNVSYEIRMDNACVDKCYVDDFFLYYKIINGNKVEIEQIGPNDRFKDSEAPCNPVTGDPSCNFGHYSASGGANCS
jgi:hypothetical protein